MENIFLKDNVITSKQNDKTGKNVLKLIKIDAQNEFLFEKNKNQFVDLVDYLGSNNDIWVLTGYTYSGKSLLTSVIPQLIRENVIFYHYKCTKSSTLDDILLSFFEIFKSYAKKGLVRIPKIETQNFQERINIYFATCENPIIIMLDGANEIKDANNKEAIMEFMSHIPVNEKIKRIVTTRAFDVSDVRNINLRLATSLIKPLSKEDLNDYCLKNVINSDGIEEFSKLSHGHYLILNLMMNYIKPTNLTISEFVKEMGETNKNIEEYLIAKNLSFVPSSYVENLWFLASADFAIPKAKYLSLKDASEEQLNLLMKKGIIEIFDDNIYLRDFYKTEILKSIEPLAQQTITKNLINFLEEQLPLKPALRELKISRATIRKEIERLKQIINKAQQIKQEKTKSNYMNILGYSTQYKTSWDGFDEIIMPKSHKKSNEQKVEELNQEIEKSEEEINEKKPEKQEEAEISSIKFAQMMKDKYLYPEAIVQYNEALEEALRNQDDKLSLVILKEMAQCYFSLNDYKSAIENYGKAHELAKNQNMPEECYFILLKIAEIYKQTYKTDLAKEIYSDIIAQENLPKYISLEAELNLFEINFTSMQPSEILQNYYRLLEKSEGLDEISAKIHFRLGFLYDNASRLDEAETHYKKSIEICDDFRINKNISSCYYNLGEIYYEEKEYNKALDNYLKSLSTDEITKNTDGMLLTTKKIAKIYEKQNDAMAVEYYEKALDLAKSLDDNYPIACAYIDLGDYYYRQRQDIKALRGYMSAKKIMQNQLTDDNAQVIEDRLADLEVRMGKDVAQKLIREFY